MKCSRGRKKMKEKEKIKEVEVKKNTKQND